MSMKFIPNVYYGYIVKGDLRGAISYVKQFADQNGLSSRFASLFEYENYITYDIDPYLDGILKIYQQYYRDVFFLCIGKDAAEKLRARLCEYLTITNNNTDLDDIENNQLTAAFADKGYHFLGGRTGGYRGPYVWKTTEPVTYDVELPGGIQTYAVKLLDGFITKSWIDYLSLGEISPGGWTDGDGIINCVKSSYDFQSENFNVSLLKHEAQHVKDLARCKNMSSEDLEYRAKLVELIYSQERNLMEQFAQEADSADKSNGHTAAAGKILEEFARKLERSCEEIQSLPITQIQAAARELFEESNAIFL